MLRSRRRVYSGKNIAYGLICWLNRVPNTAAKGRIVSFINTATALRNMPSQRLPTVSLNPENPGLCGNKAQFRASRELSRLERRLNRLLKRYDNVRWRYSHQTAGLPRYSCLPVTNSGVITIDVVAGGDFGSFRFGESEAMEKVRRLDESGYLYRVRRCGCGRWFYAQFEHRKFCGEPCQKRDFRKTDQFREHRRGSMCTYRLTVAKLSGRPF
jgi:hypothetical protein